MEVIGHEDKTVSEPMVTANAINQERNETIKNFIGCKDGSPILNTEGKEVRDIAVSVGPDAMEAAQTFGMVR